MAKKMTKEIVSIQNNTDAIILDNPLASPKFIRLLGKDKQELISDTYTPKLFYEIISRLTPEHLQNIVENQNIKLEIKVKQFLNEIGANEKNYKNLIISVKALQTTLLEWKEDNKFLSTPIITFAEHEPKSGKVDIQIHERLVKRILEVKEKGNFSFLKSNIFLLQNSQAIKLYPFFKSWLNKGRYETDLERFKIQFGYNTSGYNRFSNFESRVLEPATQEINNKTDIVVSYELTGDNIGGERPRIKGLIFYITSKEKVKQLSNGEYHEPPKTQDEKTHISNLIKAVTPQEQTAQPQKIQLSDQPNHAQIIELGEKLKLNNIQVQTIMDELKGNHIRAFEVLQGCINEGKAKIINSNFAYIIGSINTLGVGLWQQEQAKAKKKEAEKIEKDKQATIQKIQTEYQERKKAQFLKIYEKASDQEKAELLENIRETKAIESLGVKRNYYINKETQKLNEGGEILAGSILAEQKNTGIEVRQNKYRNEVFEKYSYQIGYDENDQVIILGLFENVEQQPTPPQSIEATEPTAEPKKKAEVIKPQEQKTKVKIKREPKKVKNKEPATTEPTPSQPTEQPQDKKQTKKGFFSSIGDLIQSQFKK
jgi:hypothetical protein